ncbi:hypothetical protein [Kibdelosporangium aridum]|uniref:Uncharacterized protein n=1 Tax=Kibdelosporangium aridum TaxID=2030 RepID=A0A1W2FTL8_KIBAR|nr:hypothetical protein [Kibdelosporangium aridum]SMD25270.1 hypothetical protein SAMN05661093_09008 [Kibdelosporangium aridum]
MRVYWLRPNDVPYDQRYPDGIARVMAEAQQYYKQKLNRWYGGMVHELGHTFGLPDSSYTDGTPMSASFYNYPNTHFNEQQKNAIRNGPHGSFLF